MSLSSVIIDCEYFLWLSAVTIFCYYIVIISCDYLVWLSPVIIFCDYLMWLIIYCDYLLWLYPVIISCDWISTVTNLSIIETNVPFHFIGVWGTHWTLVYTPACTLQKRSVFLLKKFVRFAWESCETDWTTTNYFWQTNLKYPCDRYLKKYAFPWSTCRIYKLACGSVTYFCDKYVTDTSNLTYLFTDLPYFFVKIQLVFKVYQCSIWLCPVLFRAWFRSNRRASQSRTCDRAVRLASRTRERSHPDSSQSFALHPMLCTLCSAELCTPHSVLRLIVRWCEELRWRGHSD